MGLGQGSRDTPCGKLRATPTQLTDSTRVPLCLASLITLTPNSELGRAYISILGSVMGKCSMVITVCPTNVRGGTRTLASVIDRLKNATSNVPKIYPIMQI